RGTTRPGHNDNLTAVKRRGRKDRSAARLALASAGEGRGPAPVRPLPPGHAVRFSGPGARVSRTRFLGLRTPVPTHLGRPARLRIRAIRRPGGAATRPNSPAFFHP